MRVAFFVGVLLPLLIPMAGGAHGDWPPKHGGMMNDNGETSFELVQVREGIRFYVEDHGDPLPTAGSTASLTVTRNGKLTVFDGRSVRQNELFFPTATAHAGDKVMVKVTFANGSIAVGRYVLPQGALHMRAGARKASTH